MSVKENAERIMEEGAQFCLDAAAESKNECHVATFSSAAMIIQSLASIVHLLPEKNEWKDEGSENLRGRLFALETIAEDMGWEDSAYHFFQKLGLGKEFPDHEFNKSQG